MIETGGTRDSGTSWAGYLEFVREWARAPLRTGAIAPSSSTLAREMVFAAAPTVGKKVVELGPGTGKVTRALLDYGIHERDLVLVELNPEFAVALQRQFPKATVMAQDAFDAISALRSTSHAISAIVSSLPLFVHPHHRRLALVENGLDLAEPLGRFVQFTYHLTSPLHCTGTLRAMRSRRVWGNLPPATVWTYQSRLPAGLSNSDGVSRRSPCETRG